MATSTAEKMRIKLVVDGKANKVLFAEAGKDFVDFLIGLLTLPLSSVIRVLPIEKMAGSLGELYESVGKLDDIYIQSSVDMANVLKSIEEFSITPTPPPSVTCNPKYYTCRNASVCCSLTSIRGNSCVNCEGGMSEEMFNVDAITNRELAVVVKSKNKGFVERAGSYMVMDDLVVKPLSTNSLKKLEFYSFSFVKEMAVDVGMEEGLELLRVSMQSKTVLTDVFLSKNSTTPGVLQIKRENTS